VDADADALAAFALALAPTLAAAARAPPARRLGAAAAGGAGAAAGKTKESGRPLALQALELLAALLSAVAARCPDAAPAVLAACGPGLGAGAVASEALSALQTLVLGLLADGAWREADAGLAAVAALVSVLPSPARAETASWARRLVTEQPLQQPALARAAVALLLRAAAPADLDAVIPLAVVCPV
jgi:hypothetical protein